VHLSREDGSPAGKLILPGCEFDAHSSAGQF